jgi:hypothetical protein
MITFTRVKGLLHKNVAAKGPVFPARMDRLSNNRAPDLFGLNIQEHVRGGRAAKREVVEGRGKSGQ